MQTPQRWYWCKTSGLFLSLLFINISHFPSSFIKKMPVVKRQQQRCSLILCFLPLQLPCSGETVTTAHISQLLWTGWSAGWTSSSPLLVSWTRTHSNCRSRPEGLKISYSLIASCVVQVSWRFCSVLLSKAPKLSTSSRRGTFSPSSHSLTSMDATTR